MLLLFAITSRRARITHGAGEIETDKIDHRLDDRYTLGFRGTSSYSNMASINTVENIDSGQHDQLPAVDEILVKRGNHNWSNKRISLFPILKAGAIFLAAGAMFAIGFGVGRSSKPKSGGDSNDTGIRAGGENRDFISAKDLISKRIALKNGQEFDNESSYQSRALKILSEKGVVEGYSDQKLAQRYALLCLYYSTNRVRTDVTDEQFGYGTTPGWHVMSPWKFVWENDECVWYGIACNTEGLVVRIELTDHLLTGYIPMELKLLKNGPVSIIDFSGNRGLGQGGFPRVFSELDSLGKS